MRNINFIALIILLFFNSKITKGVAIPKNNLDYIENKGQWHSNVLFETDLKGGSAFLEKDGITYIFTEEAKHQHQNNTDKKKAIININTSSGNEQKIIKGHAYNFKWLNCNPLPYIQALNKQSAYNNYFIGNDTSEWASNVGLYKKVLYQDLYYNINAILYSEYNSMKTDYVVKSGGNPADIKIQYNATDGIEITAKGELKIKTSINEVFELKPYAYQIINNIKKEVICLYKLNDNTVSFKFPDGYDKNYELIIDPTLIFSTYSGSPVDNWGSSATNDAEGNMFLGGVAFGQNYPTTLGAFQTTFGGGNGIERCDIVITKFNAIGKNRLYSTYLGGRGNELLQSLYCTPKNELIILSTTGSNNFPTTNNAYIKTFSGGDYINIMNIDFPNGTDIALTKLNANGTALIGSTYFGGNKNDGTGILVNYGDETRGDIVMTPTGDIIIGSSTASGNLPGTSGSFQPNFGGAEKDGFIAKFSSNLSTLDWASYFGSTGNENINSLKIDKSGNIFICGGTNSDNLTGRNNGLNPDFKGYFDGYISKINSTGTQVLATTYLGTADYDQTFLIDLDDDDNIVAFGQTAGNYPVSAGVYFNNGAGQFIHKLNNNLNTSEFSTVFGSENAINISPTAFMVDICGNIYAVGWGGENVNQFGSTYNMPTTADAFQKTTDGNDFYFINLNKDATQLIYATYFGEDGGVGDHVDGGTSRFDKNGVVYQAVCASCGNTDQFPVTSGVYSEHNESPNCNMAGFKFKFDLTAMKITSISPQTACITDSIQFNFTATQPAKTFLWDFGDGNTSVLPSPKHKYNATGTYIIQLRIFNDDNCNIADSTTAIITISEPTNKTIDTAICSGQSIILGNQVITKDGTYIANLKNAGGCDSTVTLNVNIKPNNTVTIDTTICQGESVTINNQKFSNAGTYTITIKQSSGCDSVITLKLKVNPTSNIRTTTYICKGEAYIFNNQTISEPGIYVAKFKNARGCDSTVTMTLIVIQPDSVSIDTSICGGHPLIFNGQEITALGSYTAVLKNMVNCDSIVTLNLLAINSPSSSTIDTTICEGDIFNFNGQDISISGTYTSTLTNSKGCDSIVTLHLKVNPLHLMTIDTSLCSGDSIVFKNQTITSQGIYTFRFANPVGCDSIITLNVTNRTLPILTNRDTGICQGNFIVFNHQIITEAGIYLDTIKNNPGCDTIITLNVIIHPKSASILNQTICEGESIIFNNQTITKQGIYTDTLLNQFNCDSIIILNLIVNNQPVFISIDTSICQGDFIVFNHQHINNQGIYSDTILNPTGCDTVIVLRLNINPSDNILINKTICEGDSVTFNNQVIYNQGIYTEKLKNKYSCDSIITLHLTTNNQPFFINLDTTICQGETIIFQHQIITKEGTYTDTLKSPFVCDTIITLNVNINNLPISVSKDTAICQGDFIIFNHQTITTSGIYKDTIIHPTGCDTIISLNVHVNLLDNIVLNKTICEGDSVIFNNQVIYTQGSYSATFKNYSGCDSTVTLHLATTNQPFSINLDTTICQGVSIVFNNQIINTSGTYSYTIKSPFGCDTTVSLTVQISNQPINITKDTTICQGDFIIFNQQIITNAGIYYTTVPNPFGCDSVITLNVQINQSRVRTTDTSICQGNSILFNNQVISVAGTYSYRIQNNNGCDSIIILNLHITPPIFKDIDAQICKGGSYTIGSQTFTQTGQYSVTLVSSATQCDSVVQLNLSIVDTLKETLDYKICQGDSIVVENTVYKTSGTYFVNLKSAINCDSLIIIRLKVIEPAFSNIAEKICEGDSIFVGNKYYKEAGNYTIKIKSSEQCDSTITFTLVVNPKKQTQIDTTVCAGTIIRVGNKEYSVSGNYTDTLKTSMGCDSVVSLQLKVLDTFSTTLNPEICEGETYQNGSNTYTETGNYIIKYNAVNGCDSIVNIHLTVHPKKITNLTENICEGDSVIVGNQVFKDSGTYSVLLKSSKDCDSTVNLILNVFQHQNITIDSAICEGEQVQIGSEIFTQSGKYTIPLKTIHQCDSIIYLSLLVNPTPVINAVVDSGKIQKGKQVQLDIETLQNYIYLWQNSIVSNPTIKNPTAVITEPIWFVVEATDPNTRCKSTDSVFVNIYYLPCNKNYIYIPNAFTPNNDGINDIFKVRSENLIKGDLVIFDRWGNKVFESDDLNIGWDGSYKGKKQQAENYGFFFTGTCEGGETVTIKGSITLLE